MNRHQPGLITLSRATLTLSLLLLVGICACDNSKPETVPTATTVTPPPPPAATTTPPPPKPTFIIETRGKDAREMVKVPAGPFTRGSLAGVGRDEEHPQKTITLKTFWIDRQEVTVADYKKCVSKGACKSSTFRKGKKPRPGKKPPSCNYGTLDRENHPINCVSWFGAKAYCAWAGKRLPTEAEWEKSARGTDGRTFPWGDDIADCSRACMIKRSMAGCGKRTTCPVGSYPQGVSPYGAMDMSGNVYEWVADSYSRGYYAKAPDSDPINKEKTTFRPGRGGAFSSDAEGVRTTQRSGFEADERISYFGFRCAMN